CFSMLLLHPSSSLFPYTTLFRSAQLYPDPATRRPPHRRPFLGADRRRELLGVEHQPSCSAPAEGRGALGARGWNGHPRAAHPRRSEEHTSELQSRVDLVCRLLLE